MFGVNIILVTLRQLCALAILVTLADPFSGTFRYALSAPRGWPSS